MGKRILRTTKKVGVLKRGWREGRRRGGSNKIDRFRERVRHIYFLRVRIHLQIYAKKIFFFFVRPRTGDNAFILSWNVHCGACPPLPSNISRLLQGV